MANYFQGIKPVEYQSVRKEAPIDLVLRTGQLINQQVNQAKDAADKLKTLANNLKAMPGDTSGQRAIQEEIDRIESEIEDIAKNEYGFANNNVTNTIRQLSTDFASNEKIAAAMNNFKAWQEYNKNKQKIRMEKPGAEFANTSFYSNDFQTIDNKGNIQYWSPNEVHMMDYAKEQLNIWKNVLKEEDIGSWNETKINDYYNALTTNRGVSSGQVTNKLNNAFNTYINSNAGQQELLVKASEIARDQGVSKEDAYKQAQDDMLIDFAKTGASMIYEKTNYRMMRDGSTFENNNNDGNVDNSDIFNVSSQALTNIQGVESISDIYSPDINIDPTTEEGALQSLLITKVKTDIDKALNQSLKTMYKNIKKNSSDGNSKVNIENIAAGIKIIKGFGDNISLWNNENANPITNLIGDIYNIFSEEGYKAKTMETIENIELPDKAKQQFLNKVQNAKNSNEVQDILGELSTYTSNLVDAAKRHFHLFPQSEHLMDEVLEETYKNNFSDYIVNTYGIVNTPKTKVNAFLKTLNIENVTIYEPSNSNIVQDLEDKRNLFKESEITGLYNTGTNLGVILSNKENGKRYFCDIPNNVSANFGKATENMDWAVRGQVLQSVNIVEGGEIHINNKASGYYASPINGNELALYKDGRKIDTFPDKMSLKTVMYRLYLQNKDK